MFVRSILVSQFSITEAICLGDVLLTTTFSG